MEIQTYEIEEQVGEVAGTTQEIEAEAVAMIEELGLTGQSQLITQAEEDIDEDGVGVRIPYPKMSPAEVAIYETLFPVKDPVHKYSATIIPIRVMQVIQHAKGLFKGLFIWHDKVMNPDPVLVGTRAKPEGQYGDDYYLLARWGDALVGITELKKTAEKALTEDWRRKIEKKKLEVAQFEAALPVHVATKLNGEWVPTPF